MITGVLGTSEDAIGIAVRGGYAGHEVRVSAEDPAELDVALHAVLKSLERARSHGDLTRDQVASIGEAIVGVSHADLTGCDVVVDAGVRSMTARQSLLSALDLSTGRAVLLIAGLDSPDLLGTLAAELADPGRLGGLWFLDPPQHARAVELVAGSTCSASTTGTAGEWCTSLGWLPVPVDRPGAVLGRLERAVRREAQLLVESGVVDGPILDRIWSAADRHPVGPLLHAQHRSLPETPLLSAAHAGEPDPGQSALDEDVPEV